MKYIVLRDSIERLVRTNDDRQHQHVNTDDAGRWLRLADTMATEASATSIGATEYETQTGGPAAGAEINSRETTLEMSQD